ncbi:hypothetical protein DFH06DRAFT_990190, partial [Mycena polygramma]
LRTFRPHSSEFGFFLDWDSFLESLQPISPGASHPSALLNAIYMWGAHLSSDAERELEFKNSALHCAVTQLAAESFLHTVQTEVLLSYFFFRTGVFLEARTHASAAAALIVAGGLYHTRSVKKLGGHVIEVAAADAAPLRLRAPTDVLEEGERINGFWAVFVLQKILSVALDPPERVCGAFEGRMTIDTPWPLELSEYREGLLTPDVRRYSSVATYLAGVPTCQGSSSRIEMNVKACILLQQAVTAHGEWRPGMREGEAQSWRTAFTAIDERIHVLRSELGKVVPVQGGRGAEHNILLTSSLLDAATIHLHSVFYWERVSAQRCLTAALHMLRLAQASPQWLGYHNPMMSTLLIAACSVFDRELRLIRAEVLKASRFEAVCKACKAQLKLNNNKPAGLEKGINLLRAFKAKQVTKKTDMVASLQDGIHVLSAFAADSLVVR